MPSDIYCNNTVCVRSNDIKVIERAIVNLLQKEGGTQLENLPSLAKEAKPWIVGIFPGKNGWTVIKTFPSEFLCAKTIGNSRPRLSTLTSYLGCDAFNFSVIAPDDCGILLEANSIGECYVTGYCHIEAKVEFFYDQPINKIGSINKFSLLQVSELLESAINVNQSPLIIQGKIIIEPDSMCKFPFEYQLQSHHERIDNAFRACIDISGIWRYPNIHRVILKKSNESSLAQGRLLYFQPPNNYKHPDSYKLTRQQWLDIYDMEPPTEK